MSVASQLEIPPQLRKPREYVTFIMSRNPGMTLKNAMTESRRLRNANDPLWREFEAEYKYDMIKSKIIELYHMVTNQEDRVRGGRKSRKTRKQRM